jgi:hypothetical protein
MTVLICCPIPIRKSDVAALDADAMAIDTPGNLSAVGIDQKPKIKREKKQKPSGDDGDLSVVGNDTGISIKKEKKERKEKKEKKRKSEGAAV